MESRNNWFQQRKFRSPLRLRSVHDAASVRVGAFWPSRGRSVRARPARPAAVLARTAERGRTRGGRSELKRRIAARGGGSNAGGGAWRRWHEYRRRRGSAGVGGSGAAPAGASHGRRERRHQRRQLEHRASVELLGAAGCRRHVGGRRSGRDHQQVRYDYRLAGDREAFALTKNCTAANKSPSDTCKLDNGMSTTSAA